MSSSFRDWTPRRAAEHNEKIAPVLLVKPPAAAALMAEARESEVKQKTAKLKAANGKSESEIQGEIETKKRTQRMKTANGKFEIQPSTDELKLNKTERAYLMFLRSRQDVAWIGVQNLTVKLADDCRLTPDFAVLDQSGKLLLIDVKGFQREDALIKMKVAARQFPMFHFYIVKREGLGWSEEIVNV